MKDKIAALLSRYSPSEQQTILAEIDLEHLRAGLILNKALCRAVASGSPLVVDFLLALGADPSEIALNGRNALHIAAWEGRLNELQALIRHGGEIDIPDIHGATPLFLAIEKKNEDLALFLLEKGADIHGESYAESTCTEYRGDWVLTDLVPSQALEAAANQGLDKVVKRLIDLGADPKKGNPLYYAARSGHLSTVKLIVEERQKIPGFNLTGSDYHALRAAIEVDEKIAHYLLEKFGSISSEAREDLFKRAVSKGSIDLVKKFVSLGAAPESFSESLWAAVVHGREEIAFFLYPNTYFSEDAGLAILSQAARRGLVDLVRLLMNDGVNPNRIVPEIVPPLFAAAEKNHLDLIRTMIRHGADEVELIIEDPFFGCSINVLDIALANGAYDTVQFFLKLGMEFLSLNAPHITALHFVCYHGYTDLVKRLIEQGAEIDAKDSNGRTPLFYTLISGKNTKEIVDLLTQHGANLWAVDLIAIMESDYDFSKGCLKLIREYIDPSSSEQLGLLLIGAVQNEEISMVCDLIEQGAPIYFLPHGYQRAIDRAVYLQNGHLTKLLINASMPLEIKENREEFLHAAVKLKCLEFVQLLIGDEVDLTIKDSQGNSLLHFFALENPSAKFNRGWYGEDNVRDSFEESREIAKILVNYADDINVQNNKGLSPLHIAVEQNHVEIAAILLSLGADVNLAANGSGKIPLHLAKTGECVDLLIEHGAHLEARDARGSTPLDCAIEREDIDALLSLLDYGAHIETLTKKPYSSFPGLIDFLKRKCRLARQIGHYEK